MAGCADVADILNLCDSTNLNLVSGALLVKIEAVSVTKNATNPFLLDNLDVIDPATGAYPLATSDYYPVKAEWYLNSAKPNYEVVEGTSTPDKFIHTIGNIVITNSESAIGKQNIKGLNANLWVLIAKVKGVTNQIDTFHVFGLTNGLKFLPTATSDEFGGRVVGSFKSLAGGEEPTPNGVNWLETSFENTNTLFNQRLNPVIVP